MKNKKFFYQVLISALVFFSSKLLAQAEPAMDAAIITVQPSFLSVTAGGDRAKFEEDNWTSRNASGGIEDLTISKQLNKQDSLEFEGKAIAGNNDYNADLTLAREGLGSLSVAFKDFRKYYDSTGGYYPGFAWNNNNPVEPNKDLHLDIGNFKIEGILAKENSPQYSLSYERDFRHGTKSLLEWGAVIGGAVQRQLYPAYLKTEETVDRLKTGVKYTTKDSEVSAEQIWESTKAKNRDNYRETLTLTTGVITSQKIRSENMDSDLYSTILRGSKDLNDKLSLTCGVLYNHYLGGSLENLIGTTDMDNPAIIDQNSVTIFPNIYFKPFKNLSLGFGSKSEFINKNGNSAANNLNAVGEILNIASHTYKKIFTQDLQLKYNGMKNVACYADAVFEKKLINQFEEQDSCGVVVAADNFSRKTDSTADTNSLTLGFKWYPTSRVNVTIEDKYQNKFIRNNNEFLTGDVLSGYRTFIDRLDIASNSPVLKLNYKPFRWMAYTLGYTFQDSVYGLRTRAGASTEIAKNKVHAYSAQIVLTPVDYFYCSLFYERRNDFTSTRADGAGGAALATQIPDYKANVNVLGLDCNYALSKSTTLAAGFSMYKNENYNNFAATGMPYGLNNLSQDISFGIKHILNKSSSLELKYKYLNYSESSNNFINDYEAHLLSATMNMAF